MAYLDEELDEEGNPISVPQGLDRDVFKRLYQARKASNENLLGANLADAGNRIGYAIAGVPVQGQASFDALKKSAETPTEDWRLGEELANKAVARQQTIDRIKAQATENALNRGLKEKGLELDERKVKAIEESIKSKPIKVAPENQATANALAIKNANKVSIANQIEENIAAFDMAKNDNDRLALGRQMIKVLNSSEGQDAVGAEEARRLGEKLTFAYGNLTSDDPIRFGRDLKGFRTQAIATMDALRRGADKNREVIEQATGRPSPIKNQSDSTNQVLSPEKRKRLEELRAKRALEMGGSQ